VPPSSTGVEQEPEYFGIKSKAIHIRKVAKIFDIFTGLTVVQHNVCKVSPLRLSDGSLSSAERCLLVTTVTYMNATVTYVLPTLVFPSSNIKAELGMILLQDQQRLSTRLDESRKKNSFTQWSKG
jgi:hypothetical protein